LSATSDNGGGGPKRPPATTRFRKGQSGNPVGRPKKAKIAPPTSAFDIVIDRMLTITQGGRQREVTVDEALQHKTYQDSIAGSRTARREVLKMIAKREKALAARQPVKPLELQFEHGDPANAEEALLILGIAGHDPGGEQAKGGHRRLLLEPWAVQAALSRPGRKPLSDNDTKEVERCTRDAETLAWPRGGRR
jgi:hypothetical protein